MSRKKKTDFFEKMKYESIGIFLIVFSLYIIVSLLSQTGDSYILPEEKTGLLGGFLVRVISSLVGGAKYILLLLIIFLGFKLIYKKKNFSRQNFLILSLLFLSFLVSLHLRLPIDTVKSFVESSRAGLLGEGGGLIGAGVSWILFVILGLKGSYLFLISFWVLLFLYFFGEKFKIKVKEIVSKLPNFIGSIKDKLESFLFVETEPQEKSKEKKDSKKNLEAEIDRKEDSAHIKKLKINHFSEQANDKIINKIEENLEDREDASELSSGAFQLESEEDCNFELPSLDLLEEKATNNNSINQEEINNNISILQKTLESFSVKGEVAEVSCGPSITRYEYQPALGVKVSKVVNLADDIALSLASSDVRIEAPIPGKAAIGIEIPNKEISMVSLKEVLDSKEFKEEKSLLKVALGKDIAGKSIVAKLDKMPHLMIAGSTGSGKSVCMNALITSILFNAKPSDVKFIMIDPKMVELSIYNGIPHLISPVVIDPKKAASALRWAVQEMEKRYERFSVSGAKDIDRYNELVFEHNQNVNEGDKKLEKMPYIVVLIDELADLMMVAPNDVEDAICRLAQMARAAGIHLVIATQRPSVDVITGIIKANIPSRIAFSVSSQTDSRTILDMNGAEKLLGKGDMLYFPTGLSKPVRVQGVFVSDKEVERTVDFLKKQEKPEYLDEIVEQNVFDDLIEDEEDDELLEDAARLFIDSGQASISSLQRKFRIGYNRAARIVDAMEAKGIVGEHEGSKPRKVLINIQDFERIFGK